MKFDPFAWDEVNTNAENESRKGKLQLRSSAPVALYITAQGYEVLAGYGTSFDLDLAETFSFRIEAGKGVRAFRHNPTPSSVVAVGEIYTNPDRMPHESGSMAEVLRARRMLEIERRSMMAEMRQEFAAMRAASAPAPEPIAQGENETEQPDPEGEAAE